MVVSPFHCINIIFLSNAIKEKCIKYILAKIRRAQEKEGLIYFDFQSFKLKSTLRTHVLFVHSGKKQKPSFAAENNMIKCWICSKTFTRNYTLKQHLAMIHEEVTLILCDVCNEGFKRNSDLLRHKRNFHNEN